MAEANLERSGSAKTFDKTWHYLTHPFVAVHHFVHEACEWLGHSLLFLLVFGLIVAGKSAVAFQLGITVQELLELYEIEWHAQLAVVALAAGIVIATFQTTRRMWQRHWSRPHAHGQLWHYLDVAAHGVVHLYRTAASWVGKLSFVILVVAMITGGKILIAIKVLAILKGVFVLYQGWESGVASAVVALGLGIALWKTSRKLSHRQRSFRERQESF